MLPRRAPSGRFLPNSARGVVLLSHEATMRQRLAVALRDRGMTFREIAERLSETKQISAWGARDIYVKGLAKGARR
jgi:hypothetical protein